MTTATATNGELVDMREEVARLRAAGIAVCKPDPKEKKPTYTGWPTASKEPDDFGPDNPAGIIAGPLSDCNKSGHALVIIDLDATDAIGKADDFLPATGMMDERTSKPKSHRYVLVPFATIPAWAESKAPQGAHAARKAKGHPGPFKKQFRHAKTKAVVIDFLGTGGQAVCPRSLHSSGERREWVGGERGEPAVVSFPELWGAVCRLADACGCKPIEVGKETNGHAKSVFDDGPDVERRARAYLSRTPEAVSEQGGHSATLFAAHVLVWGFELTKQRSFEILRDDYNSRCKPPWSEKELLHKVEEADTVAFDKPRGWLREAPFPNESNGRAQSTSTTTAESPQPTATAAGSKSNDTKKPTAAGIILAHFTETYQPTHRCGNAVRSGRTGEMVKATLATYAPNEALIAKLTAWEGSPKIKGTLTVDRSALHRVFRDESKVAWVELLAMLVDETEAPEISEASRDEFRAAVTNTLLTIVAIQYKHTGPDPVTKQPREVDSVQRRSLIEWATMFAKPGRWESVRSYQLWSRRQDDSLRIALHHRLFGPGQASTPTLARMTPTQFTLLAQRYDVGQPVRVAGGNVRALELNPEFVSDLLAEPVSPTPDGQTDRQEPSHAYMREEVSECPS